MDTTLRAFQTSDFEAISELLATEFVINSPLHRALHIDPIQWRKGLPTWLSSALQADCSVVACAPNTHKVVGCALGWSFDPPRASDAVLTALDGLLHRLRCAAPDAHPNTCITVDMACVATPFQGHGVYRQLREAFHTRATSAGFERVRGELSSAATQRVCVEGFGHRVLAEVHYADFVWRGTRPFASISRPPSIQLIEGCL